MQQEQHPTPGNRLKKEREARNWSQKDLARSLGTALPNINRWETGKTSPQAFFREKLCQIFGKSAEELFGRPEQKPLWYMPYLPDIYFTGRELLLDRLHALLQTQKPVALTQPARLQSEAGTGKTLIAVAYAQRFASEYNSVICLRATTSELLRSDCLHVAQMALPERSFQFHAQQELFQSIQHLLTRSEPMLLILDDVMDMNLLGDLLPSSIRGHVLLTTRRPIVGRTIKRLEVGALAPEEGLLLLLRRAQIIPLAGTLQQALSEDLADGQKLYAEVRGHPYHLAQAGTYIDEHTSTVEECLRLYRRQSQ